MADTVPVTAGVWCALRVSHGFTDAHVSLHFEHSQNDGEWKALTSGALQQSLTLIFISIIHEGVMLFQLIQTPSTGRVSAQGGLYVS